MGNKKYLEIKAYRKEIRNIAIISLLTFFITFFICPYSPFFRYIYIDDEICYKILTNGLFEGKIPYRDLFDHKGPITYLIFALGYLLCGKHDLGMWIISAMIDSLGFVFAYKIAALKIKKDEALLSSILLILLISFRIDTFDTNIFVSGSKPDNFVFTLLVFSTYLFIKEACFLQTNHIVPLKTMFIIGLLCGGVFLIKLNVCFLYFVFIGCYFLWLIIRKRISEFFKSCGVFLLGLIIIMIPFLIWFLMTNSLNDFIDIYFIYNIHYASENMNISLTNGLDKRMSRISFMSLIFLSLLAFISDLRTKKKKLHTIVIAILFVIAFIFLTASQIYQYFYIVFMVFMIYGTNFASSILSSLLTKSLNSFKLSMIIVGIIVFSMIMSSVFFPEIPFAKQKYEMKIEEYSIEHPDASYIFFTSLCLPVYDKYLAGPAIKQFYIPNKMTDEMILSQFEAIKSRETNVVVYPVLEQGGDKNIDNDVVRKMCGLGYSIYQKYELEDKTYTIYMLVNNSI